MIRLSRWVGGVIASFIFIPLFAVHACDPLGCLLINKEQDLLAVITVTASDTGTAQATIDHAYFKSWRVPRPLEIEITTTTQWGFWSPRLGDHYFISLQCETEICTTKWGAWRVSGSDPSTAKLLEVSNGDHAAIQWFMNGKGSSFFGMENRMFAHTPTGDVEIYPVDRSVIVPIVRITPPWLKTAPIVAVGALFATISIGLSFHLTLRRAKKQ
jgi:hypothetical protein